MAKRSNPYDWPKPAPRKVARIIDFTEANNAMDVEENRRSGYSSVARTRGAMSMGEMKYFDTALDLTPITACTTTWPNNVRDPTSTINLGDAAVANPNCLFCPKVSAALNGRVGRNVKVMKIKISGHINVAPQAGQTGSDASAVIRMLLVIDQQTNSSQMNAAQLLNDALSADNTIHSYQNPNNFGRFRVLKDKRVTLSDLNMVGSPTTADVTQAGKVIPFKFSHRFAQPLLVHFNATNGGTIADIVDNSFHFIIGTSSSAYAPNVTYYSRVSYKE